MFLRVFVGSGWLRRFGFRGIVVGTEGVVLGGKGEERRKGR